MTVTTTDVLASYTGSPPTVNFAVPFQFWSSAELIVTERVIATGVRTVLTNGVDYTVTGGLGSTGTVIATTAPAATVEWHILRNTLTTQQNDFTPSTLFPSAGSEESHDRAAMRDQEDRAVLDRAMLIPVEDGALDMTLPSSVDRGVTGAMLGFDAAGLPIVVTSALASPSVTPFIETLLDDTTKEIAVATLGAVRNDGSALAIKAGLLASIGVAATEANEFYASTNTGQLFYSDGSSWIDLGFRKVTNATLPASIAVPGRLAFDTNNREALWDNGTALVPFEQPWPVGHRYGGKMSLSTVTTANQAITVQPWYGRTGTTGNRNLRNATLAAAMEKDLTPATWSAGDQGGARPTGVGLTNNTWYHVFVISKKDGTTDWGIDTAITATNLLAEATGYLYYTRIGSVKTQAAATVLEDWNQFGRHFSLKTKVVDYDGTTDYSARTALTITVPPDVTVKARIGAIILVAGANGGIFTNLLGDVDAPPDGNSTMTPGSLPPHGGIADLNDPREVEILTTTTKTIGFRADNSTTLTLYVAGWEDFIDE